MSKFVEESERKRKLRLKSIKSTLGCQLKNNTSNSNKCKNQSGDDWCAAAGGASRGVKEDLFYNQQHQQHAYHHQYANTSSDEQIRDFDLRNIAAPSSEKTKSGLRLSVSDHHKNISTTSTAKNGSTIEIENRRDHMAQANKNIRRQSVVSKKIRDNYAVTNGGTNQDENKSTDVELSSCGGGLVSLANYYQEEQTFEMPTRRSNVYLHWSSIRTANMPVVLHATSSTLCDSDSEDHTADAGGNSLANNLETRRVINTSTTDHGSSISRRSSGQHCLSSISKGMVRSKPAQQESEHQHGLKARNKQSCSIRVIGPLECKKLEKQNQGGTTRTIKIDHKKGNTRKKLLNQNSSRGVSLESLVTEKEEAFRILQEIKTNSILGISSGFGEEEQEQQNCFSEEEGC